VRTVAPRSAKCLWFPCAAAAFVAVTFVSLPNARAQTAQTGPRTPMSWRARLALHLDGGLGSMLSEDQQQFFGYGVAIQGAVRPSVTVVEPVSIQLVYANWWFFGGPRAGQNVLLGGGIRIEPRVFDRGRIVVDTSIGAGFTGPYVRFAFDVGIGFTYAVVPWFSVGPMVRYARLLTVDGDVRSDAQSWSGGAVTTFRIPEPLPAPAPVPPPDRDHDGVVNADDRCPDEPRGEHPDPELVGCPIHDADGDTVPDDLDACPTTAAGDHPDPARVGCPEHDTDGDGLLDSADRCVNVAAGPHPDPERAGCPEGDEDHDGVLDHADACRTVPPGLHPDPARPGCPLPDRDADGVPDPTDHCPDQPGAPHPDPRRNGCPGLVRLRPGELQLLRPVFFATRRDRILARSNAVLQAVADALRASPEIRRASIEGHTDNVGDDAQNAALSQRRADRVVAWLVRRRVEAGRLEAHGLGEARPIASNDTPAGRAQNRRVEIHIVDPAPPQASNEPSVTPVAPTDARSAP